jgi:hypothetical protein
MKPATTDEVLDLMDASFTSAARVGEQGENT